MACRSATYLCTYVRMYVCTVASGRASHISNMLYIGVEVNQMLCKSCFWLIFVTLQVVSFNPVCQCVCVRLVALQQLR